MVAFVDFKKALNTVNRRYIINYLYNTLTPIEIIKVIKSLYTDIVLFMIYGNDTLEGIKYTLEVKERDKLSPLIFIFYSA